MIKKFFLFCILLHIFIGFSIQNVFTENNDIYYYVNNGILYITSDYSKDSLQPKLFNDSFDVDRKEIIKVCIEQLDSKKTITSMYGWFKDFSNLKKIEGLNNIDTSCVKDFSDMFCGCKNLEVDFLESFDFSNAETMQGMFCGCENIESINLSTISFDKLINMNYIFQGCDKLLKVDFSNSIFPCLNGLRCAFDGCKSLVEVNFDNAIFPSLIGMSGIFNNCYSIKYINLSNFNLSNLTSICDYLFVNQEVYDDDYRGFASHCRNLEKIDFPNDSTIKVFSLSKMFYDCPKLREIDLSMFDTSDTAYYFSMFKGCSSLEKVYINPEIFDLSIIDNVSNDPYLLPSYYLDNIFEDCVLLSGGKGTSFDNANIGHKYAHIDGGPDNPGYFTDIADYKPLNQIMGEETPVVDDELNVDKTPIIEYFVVAGVFVLIGYFIKRKMK